MLLRNINPVGGLVNGTRMIITKLSPHSIVSEILGDTFDREERWLPWCKLATETGFFPLL